MNGREGKRRLSVTGSCDPAAIESRSSSQSVEEEEERKNKNTLRRSNAVKTNHNNSSGNSNKSAGGLDVEYFDQGTGKWTKEAALVLSRSKHKFYIRIPDRTPIRYSLDETLRVEHSRPLTKDFHLLLTGSGGRHRIAVFSEEDGQICLNTFRRHGVQVIVRRTLPPTVTCSSSGGKYVPLRPISEGALLSFDPPKSGIGPSVKEEAIEMRHPPLERRSVIRRKSTGSTSDLRKTHSLNHESFLRQRRETAGEGDSRDHAQKYNLLPRSSSLSVKQNNRSSAVWYYNSGSVEESRGLNTGSTVISKKKQHSDQSLNSDEISSRSSAGSGSNSNHSSVVSSDSEEVFEDHDAPDGFVSERLLGKKGTSPSSAASSEQDIDSWDRRQQRRRKQHLEDGGSNENLERWKFMLTNIEEDESILDPGTFGVSGDFAQVDDFDDYPVEVLDNNNLAYEACEAERNVIIHPTSPGVPGSPMEFQAQRSSWIRRSFDNLNMEVSQTEHIRKNSQKVKEFRPTKPTVMKPSANAHLSPDTSGSRHRGGGELTRSMVNLSVRGLGSRAKSKVSKKLEEKGVNVIGISERKGIAI